MDWLFYLFSALILGPAMLVAVSRNPVNAAMNMILSFVGVAGMLVLLESYFLAILQVLVYAGAIVVLFLFIIMLIDAEKTAPPSLISYLASVVALLLMIAGGAALAFGNVAGPFPDKPAETSANLAYNFGVELFVNHVLSFQLAGVMLLIAMVGVIVISKKYEPKTPEPQEAA